ncbi:MAG TPA: TonB-dependent receptor [Rhizomicrobium sp.]|jgi:outer membrane receptor protein involved in Fe transport
MPFDLKAGDVKRRLALSSSTAVLAMVMTAPAMAQQQEAQSVEQVTVSSTRITTGGFDAPTPTTVISSEDLQKQANSNVFTTITELPSLLGSTGTTVGNGGSSNGVNGLSALNLRGLGTQRNLIMIDGERVIPTSSQGVVDISQFPQMLIQRVDVVTGGASASWGSDAVSGVVNFILDKKYEGFKLNLNGGISNYADDPKGQIQFAAGTGFMGGRAHVEVSGEFTSEAGINSLEGARKWWQFPQQLQMFSATQCQPNGCPGGSPMWVNVNNGVNTLWAYGGLITRGPLQGTQFGANGAPSQFNYGYGYNGQPALPAKLGMSTSSSTVTASGGPACSPGGYCYGGDLSGAQGPYNSIVARLVRGNTYARVSYDLTPDIEIYATGIYSEVVTWDKPTQSFFKSDNLQIGCDNPYLPTAIAQACLANNGQTAAYNSQFTNIPQPAGGLASTGSAYSAASYIPNGPGGAPVSNGFVNGFTAGAMQYGAQNSILQNVENYNNRTMRRFVLGTDGTYNLFGTDWAFKGYFEHGEVDYHNTLENILITPYYDAAIDAVQVNNNNAAAFPGVPVGSIICRSAAARSVGCQPLDIIGTTGASAAARSFVQGLNADGSSTGANGRDPWQITHQRQEVLDVGISGSPFEDWAGKISLATGFQYREEAFHTVTDCASQGNCANQVFGGTLYGPAGNPLLNPAAGPGLPPTAPNWYAGNFQPAIGIFHEWEVFAESDVPLLNDAAWGKIDVDLAGRYTHYTTSGDVETWKVGATWDTPIDGLRLRALQSRDVRAPNLAELYAGARVNNGSVTDDFNLNGGAPNQTVSPLPNPITANPNLKPEKGQTTEAGLVWSPSYVPGLNISATYYRVSVKGEITQLTQQQEMDLCFNGNALQCSFISSNGVPWATGGTINAAAVLTRPTSQTTPQVNIASAVTDGVDYELDYRFAMDDAIDWGLGGDVTIRMLATNVSKFVVNPGFIGGVSVDQAGMNGGNTPHWKVFYTQAYDTDTWGIFLNERWFSEGVINRNWVTCASACPAPVNQNFPTVSSNYMPGELYFDIGGNYNLSQHSSLYFKIDNLTNQNPGNANPYTPLNQSSNTNTALYDVIGRFYTVGFRITD